MSFSVQAAGLFAHTLACCPYRCFLFVLRCMHALHANACLYLEHREENRLAHSWRGISGDVTPQLWYPLTHQIVLFTETEQAFKLFSDVRLWVTRM